MNFTLERLGDVALPVDRETALNMTQAEKFSIVGKVSAFILEQEPTLIKNSGRLANEIHEITGTGIPFTIAAIHSMSLERDD